MQKDSVAVQALGRAAATFGYVGFVVLLISASENFFGDKEESLLMPVFALLLFIISATVTGLLVLGKPIALYISGAKKEAFTFLFATIGWLAAFLIAVGVLIATR